MENITYVILIYALEFFPIMIAIRIMVWGIISPTRKLFLR